MAFWNEEKEPEKTVLRESIDQKISDYRKKEGLDEPEEEKKKFRFAPILLLLAFVAAVLLRYLVL